MMNRVVSDSDLLGDDGVTGSNDDHGKFMIENPLQRQGFQHYGAIDITLNHGLASLAEPEFAQRFG